MAIPIKSADQIQKMRNAGRVVAQTFELLEKSICVGVTTKELDQLAEDFIRSQGGIPSFLGYVGHSGAAFTGSICTAINEQIIHGVPGPKKLSDGDIVGVDIGVYLEGFHADAARTYAVGNAKPEALNLIEVTKQAFFEGIKFAKNGRYLHEISQAIQNHAEKHGYSVVRDYCGHGVGADLHEDPQIPNYKPPGRGPRLQTGMTLAIEPMVNAGGYQIKLLGDKWTVVTRDGSLSAHYENTVLITDGEPELLTL